MKEESTSIMRSSGIFLPDCEFRTHVIVNNDNYPHSHEFIEAFYILQGSIIHCRNGQEELLTAGDMMILTPNKDTHYFKRIEGTECTHRDLMFTPSLFNSICSFFETTTDKLLDKSFTREKNIAYLSLKEIDYLEDLVQEILVNSDSAGNIQNTLIKLLGINIASKLLLKEKKVKHQENVPPWFNSFLALFKKADIIKEGLPALKKHMPLSYEHVGRLHKKIMGNTIVDHLTEVRMLYAANLLRTTDMSILQIAMDIGYNSLSHFNHTFKKHHGVSPNAYKVQILER